MKNTRWPKNENEFESSHTHTHTISSIVSSHSENMVHRVNHTQYHLLMHLRKRSVGCLVGHCIPFIVRISTFISCAYFLLFIYTRTHTHMPVYTLIELHKVYMHAISKSGLTNFQCLCFLFCFKFVLSFVVTTLFLV